MTATVIGLYSPAMQSGKTTVANHLSFYGFVGLRFAMPLKMMTYSLLGTVGIEGLDAWKHIDGEHKETPIETLDGVTPRELMQTLGTEWGRKCICEDIWVRIAINRIRRYVTADRSVVVHDLRFPNEYDALKNEGAKIVRVERPGVEVSFNHASEGALEGYEFDYTIVNDGSLIDLRDKSEQLLEELGYGG